MTRVVWEGTLYYRKMHKMQHVEQLATLRQVEHEKEKAAAAAKRKAPPNTSSSMHIPSVGAYALS